MVGKLTSCREICKGVLRENWPPNSKAGFWSTEFSVANFDLLT